MIDEQRRKLLDGEVLRLTTKHGVTYIKEQFWPPPPGQPQEPLLVGRILPDDEGEAYRIYAFPPPQESFKDPKTGQLPIDPTTGEPIESTYRNIGMSLVVEIPYEDVVTAERFVLLETAERMISLALDEALKEIDAEYGDEGSKEEAATTNGAVTTAAS